MKLGVPSDNVCTESPLLSDAASTVCNRRLLSTTQQQTLPTRTPGKQTGLSRWLLVVGSLVGTVVVILLFLAPKVFSKAEISVNLNALLWHQVLIEIDDLRDAKVDTWDRCHDTYLLKDETLIKPSKEV